MTTELKEQINAVVEARELAIEATTRKMEAYEVWLKDHELLILKEKVAKDACQEEETLLRELAVSTYTETGNKAVAQGVGIRIMSRLNYEVQKAMEWAMEHKLALKLDSSAFEKIAKTSNLPFVTITEEPTATIATELSKVE